MTSPSITQVRVAANDARRDALGIQIGQWFRNQQSGRAALGQDVDVPTIRKECDIAPPGLQERGRAADPYACVTNYPASHQIGDLGG